MPIDFTSLADYNPRQLIVKNLTGRALSIGDLNVVLNANPLPGSTIDLIKLQTFNKKPFRTFVQVANSRDLEVLIQLGKVDIETEDGLLTDLQSIKSTDVGSLLDLEGSGDGVSDHGALTGLFDDDHTQYYNESRGDTRYLRRAQDLADLADVSTARENLGRGDPSGLASLDSNGKVPIVELPDFIAGGLTFLGFWNANTNTTSDGRTLANGGYSGPTASGNDGDFYIINVAGTTSIDGVSTWNVTDYIIFSTGAWFRLVSSAIVSSVFGRTGIVIAVAGDYTASQITNVPAGGISAVTVQAAITELDNEKPDSFLELNDTPDAYTSFANRLTKVNNAADAIAFASYLYGDDSNGRLGINTTSPAERLSISGNIGVDGYFKRESGSTNSPLILVPKGTGALQVGSSGNTRGSYSVDLQTVREAVTQIAGGDYSFVAGGKNNKADGDYSFVSGILSNARKNNDVDAFTISGTTVTITGDVTLKYSNGGPILFFDLTGGDSSLNAAIRNIISVPAFGGVETTFDIDSELDDDNPSVARTGGYCVSAVGGFAAHVEGIDCRVNAAVAHAEGILSRAGGSVSHAEGYKTSSTGNFSHSEGFETVAGNPIREFTVSGTTVTISGNVSSEFTDGASVNFYALAGGSSTLNATTRIISSVTYNSGPVTTTFSIDSALGDRTSGFCVDAFVGVAAHSEGNETVASGDASHSEGYLTISSGNVSHAEGNETVASGTVSHAEGNETVASGNVSHAEGSETVASGVGSHAEGLLTSAVAKFSHVEGYYSENISKAIYSHTEGSGGRATIISQHIQGNSPTTAIGKIQHSNTIFKKETNNATPTELTSDGVDEPGAGDDNRFLIPNNKAIGFTIDIVARRDGGSQNSFFTRRGMIQNTGGTCSLVGAVQTIGTDINAAGWAVEITADDTDNYLAITVTGALGVIIDWVAVISGIELENA